MSAPAAASAPVADLPARLSFLDARAKARVVAAVKAFEGHTSAELVVTVKKHGRSYPEAHLLLGAVFGFAALLFLLFYPLDFSTTLMPFDMAIAFAVGFGLSRTVPPLQRILIAKKRRDEAVAQAAKAAFVDLGVSKTTDRTGVLVYVALLERTVAIVCDAGVTPEATEAVERARPALEGAVVRVDIRSFADTIEALGPSFAETMARSADDVNELADEVA